MAKRNKPERKRKRVIKWQSLIIGTAIFALIISTIYSSYRTSVPVDSSMNYVEFKEHLEKGEVDSAEVIRANKTFEITLTNGEKYTVINPGHDEFKKELLEAGVNMSVADETAVDAVASVIVTIPTLSLVLVIIWFLMKSFGGQTTTLYKVYKAEQVIKFDQVAGMSETKEEVRFAVSQLKNSKKLKELGTKPCKGIILEGPPGTGKTLLAKAIAGEADVPFISTNGADFIEMFAGLGAARVRQLWELAELNAPCVLFIDEIDAVGRRRSGASDGASTEANQTLNELLAKMDGLAYNPGVFVVGATNRIQDLDPALIRPGRFDKHLYVGPPKTKKDRDEIVSLYLSNKKLAEDVTLDSASRLLFGMSGAEIEQSLNEAVLISLQRGGEGIVTIEDIDAAAMKQRSMGGVRTKHASKEDIHVSAVHEAGHAVMSSLLGRKVSKISIMPYSSGVGGMTVRNTDDIEDVKIASKCELENEIKVLLAGRAAEHIIIGDTSVGCSNDIQRATMIAYRMIYNYAMTGDYLINPDVLRENQVAIIDSNDTLKKVNELVVRFNDTVEKELVKHKDELIRLYKQLEIEENVYDYSIEDFVKSKAVEPHERSTC